MRANAVRQSVNRAQINRIRQQADSHRFCVGLRILRALNTRLAYDRDLPARRSPIVGASLLANTVCLCHLFRLAQRIRQHLHSTDISGIVRKLRPQDRPWHGENDPVAAGANHPLSCSDD